MSDDSCHNIHLLNSSAKYGGISYNNKMNIMQRFVAMLGAIHRESFKQEVDVRNWDTRPAIVLMTVAFCLLALHYLKFNTAFYSALSWWFEHVSSQGNEAFYQLRQQTWFPLLSQAWWSFWHVLTFVLIPLLVIKTVLKDSLKDYGLGIGDLKKDIKWYVLLAAPILFFVFLVSFREDFSSHYPFYKLAYRSWADLIAWEILYLIQFFCVEFFFRGFIIQACRPAFGVNAIFVMIVPYMMIHFAKPWLEATGAIFFGLFLGVLAFHTRTIWGGVVVHISIALSMDIAALLQTKGLPQQWLP